MKNKEEILIEYIESKLPEFADAVHSDADMITLHQDAFAADYQEEEYILLGKAIKYAGIFGRKIIVVGNNRETLKDLN
jgi:hypothetical protein